MKLLTGEIIDAIRPGYVEKYDSNDLGYRTRDGENALSVTFSRDESPMFVLLNGFPIGDICGTTLRLRTDKGLLIEERETTYQAMQAAVDLVHQFCEWSIK
ncbi:MAG: hypothetical protein ACPGF7_09410 [Pontibacterium sp.]